MSHRSIFPEGADPDLVRSGPVDPRRPVGAKADPPRLASVLRFVRGSSFYLVMRLAAAGMTFATYILLARWMGAAELGHYVVAFSWCLILTRFATLGLGHSSLRFLPGAMAQQEPGHVHGYVKRARLLVGGAGLLLAACAALLTAWLSGPDQQGLAVLVVAILATPLLAWLSLHGTFAIALSWPRLVMLNVALRPAGLLIGVGLAWLWMGSIDALTVIWIHVAVMIGLVVVQLLLFKRAFDTSIPSAPVQYQTRAWLATSLPLMLVTLYGGLFFEYSVLFLAPLVSAESLGVFSVAYKVAFLLGFMTWAVQSASMPHLSRLYHQPGKHDRLQEALTSATRLQTTVCGLAFVALVMLGKPLLELAGPGFEDGYVEMLVVAASLVVRATLGPSSALLGITGHQKVSLTACAASLLAAPILLLLIVPSTGILGAALVILGISTGSSLWLHRQVRLRLGVHAWVFGSISIGRAIRKRVGVEDTRHDRRRSVIQICGPDLVRKTAGAFVREEYAKADAVWRVAQEHSFLAPRPIRIDEAAAAIELEYVHLDGTSKECYLDYLSAKNPSNHRMPELAASAGTVLARLHEEMQIPEGEEWHPSSAFARDLEHCGVSVRDLTAAQVVPLHGDFCLDNLAFRTKADSVVPVVLDPSPNFVVTFHPLVHGPRYVDLGLFLSGLEGRVALHHYPRARWTRVPELKARLIRAYNECAQTPVDPRIADAVGFCIAREHFRRRFVLEPLARGASCLLYNRWKKNLPHAWPGSPAGPRG